ncbi:MAG TPA: helix-turn-helix domain-containing protein [Pseudonocardiaceae bacterium]|jgi:transcriptional regulator with XRE-family HTH domain|nr:helix-turn-helix domain-containing protein [Pseudonocardiaceae bacterium]
MTTTFGAELRRLRRHANLTRAELAERSGVNLDAIRGFEAGRVITPRLKTAGLLAEALELAPDASERLLALAVGPRSPYVEPKDVSPKAVAEIADQLATLADVLLKIDDEMHEVHKPGPMPVRWQPAPAELTDPNTAGLVRPGGRFQDIHDLYFGIPSGRLVVLGRAGSGKTVLVKELAARQLSARDGRGRVPLIFRLGSWNPMVTTVRDWLVGELAREHPWMTLAGPLIDNGHILPILDGFDDIAAGLRHLALRALSAETQPMLLTSRVDEYAAAVAQADPLTQAAALELVDLDVLDLADYLPEILWRPESGHLAKALRTPLLVALARDVYRRDLQRHPRELPDSGTQAIEEHLLDSFVATACTRPQAQRWLRYLAGQLDQLDARDLVWWQLSDTMSRPARVAVLAVVVGLIFGTAGASVHGLVGSALFGAGGSVAGLALAAGATLIPRRSRFSSRKAARWHAVVQLLVTGLVIGVPVGLVEGPADGIAWGVASGLGCAITLSEWGRWLVLARVRLPLMRRLPWATIAFLDDATRRGVLRKTGETYRFSHSRVRERLSSAG